MPFPSPNASEWFTLRSAFLFSPFSQVRNSLQSLLSNLLLTHFLPSSAATPVALIAFLYLGSTIAYNSIVATAIILSYVSFSIPTVCLLLRGRKMNEQRWLKLGNFGWFANIATVAWTAFSGIMWLFPLEKNPSALSMSELDSFSLGRTLSLMLLSRKLRLRVCSHWNPRACLCSRLVLLRSPSLQRADARRTCHEAGERASDGACGRRKGVSFGGEGECTESWLPSKEEQGSFGSRSENLERTTEQSKPRAGFTTILEPR